MEHHTFKKLGIVNTNSMYSLFHKHYSNRVFVTNLISRYCITETAKAYSNELLANLSRAPSSDEIVEVSIGSDNIYKMLRVSGSTGTKKASDGRLE
jgi:hypothetical protein